MASMLGDLVVPDVTDTIVGFRAFTTNPWSHHRDDPIRENPEMDLFSETCWLDDHWAPRKVKPSRCYCTSEDDNEAWFKAHVGAYTELPDVAPPCANGTCGIHAFKSIEGVVGEYGPNPFRVHAEVWLWGSVVEHEYGFRAEFAEIKALYLPKTDLFGNRCGPTTAEFERLVTKYNAEVVKHSMTVEEMQEIGWAKRREAIRDR